MRDGVVVWIGDDVVAARTGDQGGSATTFPVRSEPLAWWSADQGPAYVAALVFELCARWPDDELIDVVLLVPAQARPRLEGALGFAIHDVDVRVVPVQDAVARGRPEVGRAGEWRGGALLWSGEGAGSVVVAPSSRRDAIEQGTRAEEPHAEFLSAERLVKGYAATLEPPADAAPVAVDDDVQFTVYRPRAVRPE